MSRKYASDEWYESERFTLDTGTSLIGSVTVANRIDLVSNVTLSDSKGFIGLATVELGSGIRKALTSTISTAAEMLNTVPVLQYLASTVSLSEKYLSPFLGDVNANLKTREQYAPGYEDNTNNKAVVEFRYTGTNITSQTTVAVKGAAGYVRGFFVGAVSSPSIIIYDNTVPSGSIILRCNVNMPLGFHEMGETFSTGLSVDAVLGGAGVAPFIRFYTR